MPQVKVYDMGGAEVGTMDLNDNFFGVEVNESLLHQAVVLQLASQRLGTHATKTRGFVKGGGRKPWRQKGTGRARAGSRRSPVWVGGGTVFGPHPRKYGFSMPRKQRRLAIKCALSDKVKSGDFMVLDKLEFATPKTKQAVKLLSDFSAPDKCLFVTLENPDNVDKSVRNIPGAKAVAATGINVYDILNHDKLFITKDAVARVEEVFA